MPFLLILSIICQILCGFHVVKTGQDRYWIFLIILAPGVGCLIYLFSTMLPSMIGTRGGQKAIKKLHNTINPTRNLKALRDALSIRDTAQTRTNLADELLALEQYEEAITHYRCALSGINTQAPETALKMAQAQFAIKDYAGCQQSLKDLLANNPGYQSQDGHLLQARALQEQGNLDAAAQTYEQLVEYYSGPDARFYYATLLKQQNRIPEAKEQLEEIQTYVRIAPKFYKQYHKACLSQVKRMLKELE